MSYHFRDSYDPYEEMRAFYRLDDPTEEEQFNFVESLEYLIKTASSPADKEAFSFNLAMYYRGIKEFRLEKKYLEIGEELDSAPCKEQLGFIWYYGLCGEQDFEKAFQYFSACETRSGQYMLADMYRDGNFVKRDRDKSREIIDRLFVEVESERKDSRFFISTLLPEIALRFVRFDLEDGADSGFDLDCILDARTILTVRQSRRPFWGNIQLMHSILETTAKMVGNEYDFIDLYDLMTFDIPSAKITFEYNKASDELDVFPDNGETIYQFNDKWYHGAEDFLEKARIDRKRITTVFDLISNIKVQS